MYNTRTLIVTVTGQKHFCKKDQLKDLKSATWRQLDSGLQCNTIQTLILKTKRTQIWKNVTDQAMVGYLIGNFDTNASKYKNTDIVKLFDYNKFLTTIHKKHLAHEKVYFLHTSHLFSSPCPVDLLLSILYSSVLMWFHKRHNESEILPRIIYLNLPQSMQCKPWSISGNDGD